MTVQRYKKKKCKFAGKKFRQEFDYFNWKRETDFWIPSRILLKRHVTPIEDMEKEDQKSLAIALWSLGV